MRLRGPVMAIVWEQWRNVRLILALTMWAGLGVLWLLTRGFVTLYTGQNAFPVVFGAVLFVLAAQGVFLLADTERWNALSFGPPKRQWQMPVRRETFLAAYLTVRVFAMALLAWVLGGGVVAMAHIPKEALGADTAGWYVSFSVASLALAFALVWANGSLVREKASMAATAFGVGTVLLVCFGFFPHLFLNPRFMAGWGTLFTAISLGVAVTGATCFDRRRPLDRALPARDSSRTRQYWPGRFKTPVEAQSWYEWSRDGMALPVLTLAGLGLWIAVTTAAELGGTCLCWPASHDSNGLAHLGYALCVRGWCVLAPLAFVVGLARAQREWHEACASRTAYARLMPMPRAMATSVRLACAHRSIGLTGVLLGMLFIAGFCITVLSTCDSVTGGRFADLAWGLTPLLAVGTALVLAWTVFWLAVPLVLLLFWASLLLGLGFVVSVVSGDNSYSLYDLVLTFSLAVPGFLAFYMIPGLTQRAISEKWLTAKAAAFVAFLPLVPLLFSLLCITGPRRLSSFEHLTWTSEGLGLALSAVVVALAGIRVVARLVRQNSLNPATLTAVFATISVLLAGVHLALSLTGQGLKFWEMCALLTACSLPVLAGLLQGYWVNRLWCR